MSRKAIFLCSKLASYFYASIKIFSEKYDVYCLLIIYPPSSLAPMCFNDTIYITIHQRSNYKNISSLKNLFVTFKPDLIYISGWFDKLYIKSCIFYKNMGVPVIMGLDNHYLGNLKQLILTTYFGKKLLKMFISKIWVAGALQFEYAIKLGFTTRDILNYVYVADNTIFKFNQNELKKEILFVGRFVEYKRADLLIKAYKSFPYEKRKGWQLKLIGNGKINCETNDNDIIIKPFTKPKDLSIESLSSAVFCLPSKNEHWGVVVHEFALQGKALLLSDSVGAGRDLLINNHNGWIFHTDDIEDLKSKLDIIFNTEISEIQKMGKISNQYAKYINQQKWAATLNNQFAHL